MKRGKKEDDLSLETNPLPTSNIKRNPAERPSLKRYFSSIIFFILLFLLIRYCTSTVFQNRYSQQDFENITIYYAEKGDISSLAFNNLTNVRDLCNCIDCVACKIPIQEII